MHIHSPMPGQPAAPNNLRPDLAAFFALPARELAPRRLHNEHGILGELAKRAGSD